MRARDAILHPRKRMSPIIGHEALIDRLSTMRTRPAGRRTTRALLVLPLVLGLACERPGATAGPRAEASPSPPAAIAGAGSIDPKRLVGRWLRGDSDYVIEIAGVASDGTLEASYRNPKPIHVSRAESRREEGALKVLVELQDRGYPGSYYTLTYDPGSDTLAGVYHHLGLNQEFDVAFTRVASP